MARRRRHRRPGAGTRELVKGQRRSGQNLVVASVLLVMLALFWNELATGAASCFGGLAPPPPGVEAPGAQPSSPEAPPPVRVKSVPKGSL